MNLDVIVSAVVNANLAVSIAMFRLLVIKNLSTLVLKFWKKSAGYVARRSHLSLLALHAPKAIAMNAMTILERHAMSTPRAPSVEPLFLEENVRRKSLC